MNMDDEIAKARADMESSEDALIDKGFSEEHWMLIKKYILSAIVHNQIVVAKSQQDYFSTTSQQLAE